MKLSKLKKRLHSLPHMEDSRQKKALANVLRFFALMLVLTLVAQGTAGATMPQVTLTSPVRGSIRQQISAQGMVQASGKTVQEAPQGAVVRQLLVKEGETVQEGQNIASFDEEQTRLALSRARAELETLRAQQSQLLTQTPADASSAAAAQQALDWAYQDLKAAQDSLAAQEAAQPVDEAALAQARQQAEAALRAAQQAQSARDSALAAYRQAQTQQQAQAQSSSAEAAVLALDIEEKQRALEQLAALEAAGFVMSAPVSGTLTAWSLTEGQAAGAQACTIADARQGYEFVFTLDRDGLEKAQTGAAVEVQQGKGAKTEAAISAIGPQQDDGSAQATVKLPTDGYSWKEGAASAVVTLSEKEYEMCLPAAAVNQDLEGTFVYVAEQRETVLGQQTVLVRAAVNILERGTDQVAVEGALGLQDRVVSGSSKPLSEGARVKVRTS